MSKPGPPPTPTEKLQRRGSWRAKTRPEEPRPKAARPRAPAWLSKDAKAVFQAVVRQLYAEGMVARTDENALARYADLFVQYRQASEFLAKYGAMYAVPGRPGPDGKPGPSTGFRTYPHAQRALALSARPAAPRGAVRHDARLARAPRRRAPPAPAAPPSTLLPAREDRRMSAADPAGPDRDLGRRRARAGLPHDDPGLRPVGDGAGRAALRGGPRAPRDRLLPRHARVRGGGARRRALRPGALAGGHRREPLRLDRRRRRGFGATARRSCSSRGRTGRRPGRGARALPPALRRGARRPGLLAPRPSRPRPP